MVSLNQVKKIRRLIACELLGVLNVQLTGVIYEQKNIKIGW